MQGMSYSRELHAPASGESSKVWTVGHVMARCPETLIPLLIYFPISPLRDWYNNTILGVTHSHSHVKCEEHKCVPRTNWETGPDLGSLPSPKFTTLLETIQ